MQNLSFYLKKFEVLSPPKGVVIRAVITAVEEVCGIVLTEEEIALHNGVIQLALHPVVRTEIILHKREITERLNGGALALRVKDVR